MTSSEIANNVGTLISRNRVHAIPNISTVNMFCTMVAEWVALLSFHHKRGWWCRRCLVAKTQTEHRLSSTLLVNYDLRSALHTRKYKSFAVELDWGVRVAQKDEILSYSGLKKRK